ncbi:uncharacterized protein LOC6616932 isoform X2 [Drosophila sechellia]|uniref:uncharacterized protein LOC6616932 isoform X2 n=1 Tax=Drosophila sechellia TaxID=7238 RepID=UPI0013DDCDD2|nr:uncharacterized protein LOC6616932 isoform X2 [Drosophila sechellia]
MAPLMLLASIHLNSIMLIGKEIKVRVSGRLLALNRKIASSAIIRDPTTRQPRQSYDDRPLRNRLFGEPVPKST